MIKINPGGKAAIIAPSAQIGDISKIQPAIEYIKSLGLIPVFGKNLCRVNRYMAGSDEERAADINAALADSEIKVIFCARAAAGGLRTLPYIDYALAKRNHKPLVGFCDNVAVQIALWQKSGLISYNGFGLAYDFRNGTVDKQIDADLRHLLNGETYTITSGKTLRRGTAEGKLICANLSTLMRMAGTPYFPDLSNKILLLEDVHEKVYRLDLMLQQLKQQPVFAKVVGVIFGRFSDAESDAEDGTIGDCFADFIRNTNFPVITDFDFGHTPSRRVLPIGADVALNADSAELKILRY